MHATLAAVLLAAISGVTDETAPEIVHTPCVDFPVREDIIIVAQVIDASPLYDPKVMFRLDSGGEFQRAPLRLIDGGLYRAVLLIGDHEGAVEYFIEVLDELGNGPARSGSPAAPHALTPSLEPAGCVQVPQLESDEAEYVDAQPADSVEEVVVAPTPAPPPPAPARIVLGLMVRVEPTAAFLLGRAQRDRFGDAGGGVLGKVGLNIKRWIVVQLSGGWVGFPEGTTGRPGGAALAGLGARVAPIWDYGDDLTPYVDAHGGFAHTGELDRFAFDVSVGLDIALAGIRVAPLVRYLQIVGSARDRVVTGDVYVLQAGLALGVDLGLTDT